MRFAEPYYLRSVLADELICYTKCGPFVSQCSSDGREAGSTGPAKLSIAPVYVIMCM